MEQAMEPIELLNINRRGDWEVFDDADYKTKQEFIQNHNWIGLTEFYTQLVKLAHPKQFADVVLQISCEEFIEEMKASLILALEKTLEIEAKAVYYEWERSVPSSDFFICTTFDSENSDWAADYSFALDAPSIEFAMKEDFEEETLSPDEAKHLGIWGVDEVMTSIKKQGIQIQEILFGRYDKEIIDLYFDAQILAALGNSWQLIGETGIVLGAAEHDHQIHIFR